MAGSNINYGDVRAVIEGELPSFILDVKSSAEEISDNSAYKVRDVYFTGTDGFVKWTMSITNLKAGRQTRGHNHPDKDEFCEIRSGDCIMTINDEQFRLTAGKFILIERTKHHKIMNVSNTEECVFINYFPGHLIRPGFVRKRG